MMRKIMTKYRNGMNYMQRGRTCKYFYKIENMEIGYWKMTNHEDSELNSGEMRFSHRA